MALRYQMDPWILGTAPLSNLPHPPPSLRTSGPMLASHIKHTTRLAHSSSTKFTDMKTDPQFMRTIFLHSTQSFGYLWTKGLVQILELEVKPMTSSQILKVLVENYPACKSMINFWSQVRCTMLQIVQLRVGTQEWPCVHPDIHFLEVTATGSHQRMTHFQMQNTHVLIMEVMFEIFWWNMASGVFD